MPSVSVVIPTYNRSDTLPRAIDSVLSQTVDDLEVIVVDDASTDGTEAVVSEYDDPRVRFLKHAENAGGGAARNTGIEAAESEYVAFLDSDDEWLPEKLERQLAALERRSDQFIAVYCDIVEQRTGVQSVLYDAVTAMSPDFEKSSDLEGGEAVINAIHANQFHLGGCSTLIVERKGLEAIDGFDEAFPRHQDLELLVRLLKVGKLAYLPDPLVVRHHTGLPAIEDLEEAKRLYFEKFNDDLRELQAEGTPVARYHRFALARNHYQRGNLWRGTRYLLRATPSHPSECLRLAWSFSLGVRTALANELGET